MFNETYKITIYYQKDDNKEKSLRIKGLRYYPLRCLIVGFSGCEKTTLL